MFIVTKDGVIATDPAARALRTPFAAVTRNSRAMDCV
jgi:hypothetical protein